MYICAQRVERPGESSGEQGINAYYYLHGSSSWQGHPPRQFLPESNPGVLADSLLELMPPGGNRVRSYIDIVAPDGTPLNHIVPAATSHGVISSFPVEWVQGNVWCRLGVERALAIDWKHELSRLLARVILLWKKQLPT